MVFLTPPNADELKRRLVGRGTETMDVIESRLSRAVEEAQGIESYDYFLINDELDACVEQFHEIVSNEKSRVFRNLENIEVMRSQLTAFAKQ